MSEPLSSHQVLRRYTADESKYTLSLGCSQCVQRSACGGLYVEGPSYSCDDFCCGSPSRCRLVCKHRSTQYVSHVREIGGYGLDDVPKSKPITVQLPDGVRPLVYHGFRRSSPLRSDTVAIPLSKLINFRRSELKYKCAASLRAAFKLSLDTRIILVGTDQDRLVESWWRLGVLHRRAIIEGIKKLDIALVTSPNFSVVLDVPRTNDLHALKCIALTCSEFSQAGLACALHTQGRTQRDFVRWGEYVRDHPEISVLAYEFTTGPGRSARMKFHIEQLSVIRRIADRPLSIVVRGNANCIPRLQRIFEVVTFLESNSFMRTMMRQQAYVSNRKMLRWCTHATTEGESLDGLMDGNIATVRSFMEACNFNHEKVLGEVA